MSDQTTAKPQPEPVSEALLAAYWEVMPEWARHQYDNDALTCHVVRRCVAGNIPAERLGWELARVLTGEREAVRNKLLDLAGNPSHVIFAVNAEDILPKERETVTAPTAPKQSTWDFFRSLNKKYGSARVANELYQWFTFDVGTISYRTAGVFRLLSKPEPEALEVLQNVACILGKDPRAQAWHEFAKRDHQSREEGGHGG